MQARDKHSSERPPWESRRVGRMRWRRMLAPAFINALCIIDGCHKDWMVVRVLFPCKNPSYPHCDRTFLSDLRRACSLDQGMENAYSPYESCSKHTDRTSQQVRAIHGWQTGHGLPSRYVSNMKIRHIPMDLPRQPWQLSC